MNWKLFVLIALIAAGAGFFIYNTTYNKPHLDVAEADVDFELTLMDLFNEFETDYEASQTKYSDKVVLVSGVFSELIDGQTSIILLKDSDGRIASCEMLNITNKPFDTDSNIKLKGLFIGYDDLMGEVQLKKCTLIE